MKRVYRADSCGFFTWRDFYLQAIIYRGFNVKREAKEISLTFIKHYPLCLDRQSGSFYRAVKFTPSCHIWPQRSAQAHLS